MTVGANIASQENNKMNKTENKLMEVTRTSNKQQNSEEHASIAAQPISVGSWIVHHGSAKREVPLVKAEQ